MNMHSVAARLEKVFEGTKAEVILLANTNLVDSNFLYMTGFTSGLFELSFLILKPKSEILITSQLEAEDARKGRPKEMKIVVANSAKQIIAALRKELKGKVVGINERFLPVYYYNMLRKEGKPRRFIGVSENFAKARAVKEPGEIENIRKASDIIKEALAEIPSYFKVGMTEKQLAARLDFIAMEHGASGPSFSTIVCFGENAADPHHRPNDTRLTKNSFVLIDCGAKYNNYSSDVTRTFIFEPDRGSAKFKRMQEILETVEMAQRLAMKKIGPDIAGSEAHNTAAEYIDSAHGGKYKGRFIHSLGHPVGIDVHDLGTRLFGTERGKLEPGMVVSNEPGIYIPGFGGVRIEDDVLVTKNGREVI